MNLKEIKQKIELIFENDKDILFAYLFGSQATGKTNFKSDVDIAVYLDEKRVEDFFEKRLKLMGDFETILKKETDVIILNDINSIFFKFVIIKEGKLVFERSRQKRIKFELETMRDYYDFKPFIEKYDDAFIKRSLAKL